MPTASLAGVLLLVALVPGYTFLRLTEAKRLSRGDVTTFQEILETVAAGLATTLPVVALCSIFRAGDLVDLVAATADRRLVDERIVRMGVWIAVLVIVASVVLAALGAVMVNRYSDTASDKFAWRDVLKTGLPNELPKLKHRKFNTLVTVETLRWSNS